MLDLYFLSSTLLNFFHTILGYLDGLSDEQFWQATLGERFFSLAKRIIGNDAVFVGIFLTFGRKSCAFRLMVVNA